MIRTFTKMALIAGATVGLLQADVIHQTTKWQSIGSETIKDGAATNSDNGVYYRLSAGDSWTQLTSGLEFDIDQKVYFKVDIWKEFQGTHYSDVAKVWIDGAEEAKGEWLLSANGNKKWGSSYYDGNVFDGTQSTGKPELLGSMMFDYTFTDAKVYELVARTMCSDDLRKLVPNDGTSFTASYVKDSDQWGSKTVYKPSTADWNAFTATNPGTTFQGEIETYTFKVRNVPEPTTLSLLGVSLLGMLFFRRKK